MARRRKGGLSRTRTVYRNLRSRTRRPKRNDLKKFAKKAAIGAALGLAVSIPLTLAGQRFGMPILQEVGQRFGSVASAHMGGSIGNAAYQGADALFDRFVNVGGSNISGSSQVYL